ncbi:unnamed protein product [Mytilus coruscus]|uniref:LRP4 n=1 Tax=Mytilus coruscus TaxID=42192 RepID=A0A6J8B090_MYTCO|nr:unnamed protein product [Mytilus coruscus]
MEFDVDTHNVTVLVDTGGSDVFALDYDYKNRYIYFPRYDIHDIVRYVNFYSDDVKKTNYNLYRFPYPSKNRTLQTVAQTDLYPVGIAVDSANDHIYWVDIYMYKLSRCNLDGTNMTVLSNLSYPWVIRLDVTNRWIYIVDNSLGIMKSRFELSEKQTIVNFTSTSVYCMDIETNENRLYWINNNGFMKSAKYDGSDVKIILSTNFAGNNIAIGVLGSYIYYADNKQLLIVTKTPGSKPTVLFNDTSRIDSIFVFNQSGM